MQDDVYLIAGDGWQEANKLRLLVEDKDQKNKEQPDMAIGKLKYKADLIPPVLLIARYFAEEQAAIEQLETEAATATQELDELKEEHGGEEGLLEEVTDDKGGITKVAVAARLKVITHEPDSAEERKLLERWVALMEREAAASKTAKEAQRALGARAAVQYDKLSEAEIKAITVDDKWLATISTDVQTELEQVSQALTGRIKDLAERYATPLPELTREATCLAAKVEAHLKAMGMTWS